MSNIHTVDILQPPRYEPNGQTQDIVTAIRGGAWLHTTDLWLYRTAPQFELLFQQRDPRSPMYAGLLDVSVAGYLHAGESGIDGAIRECREELGIDVRHEDVEYIGRHLNAGLDHRGRERKFVANIQVLRWEHDLSDLNPDPDEVPAVFWVSVDDLATVDKGSSVAIYGMDVQGNMLERRVSRSDFVPNIDDYYFWVGERIQSRCRQGFVGLE